MAAACTRCHHERDEHQDGGCVGTDDCTCTRFVGEDLFGPTHSGQ